MTDPTVQVPVSLVNDAAYSAYQAGADVTGDRLRALLSQPTPSTEPVQYNGHNGLAVFADAARRLNEGTPQGPAATPPRIEDMAPGTTFWATRRYLDVFEWDGTFVRDPDGEVITEKHIDPSTIRVVTPPREDS